MADRNHTDCRHTFTYHGFQTRSDPTQKHVEEPGRSDFTVTRDAMSVNIECKAGDDGFALSELRENQREWAQKYSIAKPFCTPYWIYLTIGTDPVNYIVGKQRPKPKKDKPPVYQPDKTWLLPLSKYLEIEAKVKPYQDTLPYMVRKHMDTNIQEQQLDAITLLAPYELTLQKAKTLVKPHWFSPEVEGETFKDKVWTIPNEHPFWLMMKTVAIQRYHAYLNQTPLLTA